MKTRDTFNGLTGIDRRNERYIERAKIATTCFLSTILFMANVIFNSASRTSHLPNSSSQLEFHEGGSQSSVKFKESRDFVRCISSLGVFVASTTRSIIA